MSAICICDVESDGVRHDRRIWEVSIWRLEPAQEIVPITMIITDSGVTGREEPEALEINRYHERFVRELVRGESRVTGYQAAQVIYNLTRGATLVGAQPQFDEHSLRRLLEWYGLTPAWKYRLRDVESLTVGHLGYDPGGLAACAEELGIKVDPTATHTSRGDVEVAAAIWRKVVNRG